MLNHRADLEGQKNTERSIEDVPFHSTDPHSDLTGYRDTPLLLLQLTDGDHKNDYEKKCSKCCAHIISLNVHHTFTI